MDCIDSKQTGSGATRVKIGRLHIFDAALEMANHKMVRSFIRQTLIPATN
jgi:hypothetical protein